jgi:hypothetical protein
MDPYQKGKLANLCGKGSQLEGIVYCQQGPFCMPKGYENFAKSINEF